MNQRDIANVVAGIVPVLREIIAEALAPVRRSVADLEKRFEAIPLGATQKDVATLADALNAVREMVVVLPGAEALVTLVDEAVARAVSALAEPEPGPPGLSVTAQDVAPLIEEMVGRAVAALPPAEAGRPGESVTLDDVTPLVEQAVARAVAALPPAEAGRPGESVTLDDVAPLVEQVVARAVAALPVPKDGAPGLLPIVEDWVDRVYKAGEAVRFNGSTYQARRITEKSPPHEAWICIAERGSDGVDGASPNMRKDWSPDETYSRLDVVNLDNAQFIAVRDDPGPCPGAGWQQSSWRGKPGRPGERGPPGERGLPGKDAPRLLALEMDYTGLVRAPFSDGITIEGDWAPQLRQLR